jgi:hypothetical protein
MRRKSFFNESGHLKILIKLLSRSDLLYQFIKLNIMPSAPINLDTQGAHMKQLSSISLIFLLLTSCNSKPGYNGSFGEDMCIVEINKAYTQLNRAPSSIYKLEEITDTAQIKVSTWHHHAWYYQGVKDQMYFENTKLFRYEETDCPDGGRAKNVGITKKLKTIDL